MSQVKHDLEQLKNGILPDNLNFTLKPNDDFDLSKIQYNTFYKSFEYFDNKYTNEFKQLFSPNVYEDMIYQSIEQSLTPIDEIYLRKYGSHKEELLKDLIKTKSQ